MGLLPLPSFDRLRMRVTHDGSGTITFLILSLSKDEESYGLSTFRGGPALREITP
jgi:hypothetical protein